MGATSSARPSASSVYATLAAKTARNTAVLRIRARGPSVRPQNRRLNRRRAVRADLYCTAANDRA